MTTMAATPQLRVVGGDDPPILEVRGVRVEFGGVRALDVERIAFGVGRMIALIGPNGAGKTTLFDAISGLVPVSRGSILLDGVHDLCRMPPVARAWRGIGRSFQSAALFESLTVAETLLVALERELQASGPLSSAFRLRGARSVERRAQRAVDELIELMGLGAFHDKFISELSTGTRRIVDLACVVAFQPRLLLLDEP
jgi:ABC-type branched-subunit amino acid transport system ATPase component